MDAEEALARLRAAPSYAPVSHLGIPPATLKGIASLPEYRRLVVDGRRKRLTRSEVDARLPRYLELLQERLRASVSPGAERVNRQQVAEAVGLSYSAVRNRTQEGHDDYMPDFAKAERAIYDEIVRDTEDFYIWLVRQPVSVSEEEGYSVKQMNPVKELLRLRHPDFKDSRRVHVTGEIGHMHLHGMLADELKEISGRFEKPVKELAP